MTPGEVDEHARSLPRCRRKGTAARPAWYVDDRLVAAHPETFGVPPSMEKHLKVQAVLDRGNDAQVRAVPAGQDDCERRLRSTNGMMPPLR